jgi:23S rRNA A1618 N6-methylase RlmF
LLKFIATDIDPLSSVWASRNIAHNAVGDKVRLVMSEKGEMGRIFDEKIFWGLGEEGIDFGMCNPPFYSDEEEIVELMEMKEDDPHAVRFRSHSRAYFRHFIELDY